MINLFCLQQAPAVYFYQLTRRKVVGLILLLLLANSTQASMSPNFILIVADDFGWSSMSTTMDNTKPLAKSDFYTTPNIGSLVNGGLRFSNGYAAAPVCSPTRYSIQFGKTPARLHRTRGMGKNHVDHNQVGIPQVLKSIDKNYRAAHIGKWHIDEDPARYGYDVHDGISKNKEGGFVNDRSQWKGYAEEDPKRVDSLTKRAIAFMRESTENKQPFFLQLSHYAVHSSIVYSEASFADVGLREKGKLHKNQGYAAMVQDMDLSVGTLLDAYRELGLTDNTYIIFISDNGGMPVLPQQPNKGKPYKDGLNSPLLRGKWDLTEGGIRVPFAIVGPGIAPGGQSDTPVISYDLLPTLAELAGSLEALPADLDGVSLRPLLDDGQVEVKRSGEGLIFHYPHFNRVGLNEPHSAIRFGEFKLIHFPVSERNLLFNVVHDAGERNDLSKQMPDLVSLLENKLGSYLKLVDAERPEKTESWVRAGQEGRTRTRLFERYDP